MLALLSLPGAIDRRLAGINLHRIKALLLTKAFSKSLASPRSQAKLAGIDPPHLLTTPAAATGRSQNRLLRVGGSLVAKFFLFRVPASLRYCKLCSGFA